MSKPRRKQAARRGPPTSSEGLARERIIALDRLLKGDAIAGRLDHDPDFRDRILAHGFNALHELVIMAHDPQYPPAVRALAMFKAGDHTLLPLKAIDAAAEIGPASITIVVAPFAAAKPSAPALPAPDETIIEADTPRNNNTPATPPMNEQTRLQKIVAAARPTQIFEVPPEPDKPKTLVGEMSQAKGYLSREEIFRRLTTKGRPQNEDRAQDENNQMPLPNLHGDNRD